MNFVHNVFRFFNMNFLQYLFLLFAQKRRIIHITKKEKLVLKQCQKESQIDRSLISCPFYKKLPLVEKVYSK